MKKLAYVLMALGVLIGIVAFNLDVTVGDSGIANLNMMAQRQNLLIVGCFGFLGGIVLLIGALQQGNQKIQPLGKKQEANVAEAISVKRAAAAFWEQRDMGRKLVLASALMLLLSFCFPWEESRLEFLSGPSDLLGTMIDLSQAVIGLLLWVYPCLASATRLRPNNNVLLFNGVIAALWIGSVAYHFHNVHEYLATQAIHMNNGIGFWLGLLATVVMIAGIVKVVRATANQGAQPVAFDG